MKPDTLLQCAWCLRWYRRINGKTTFYLAPVAPMPCDISHGICDQCLAKQNKVITIKAVLEARKETPTKL